MLVTLAIGNLDDAQPVTSRMQTHSLGIDRNGSIGKDARRQIFFVKVNSHIRVIAPSRHPGQPWIASLGGIR